MLIDLTEQEIKALDEATRFTLYNRSQPKPPLESALDKLRNAKPVQASALEKLEEWVDAGGDYSQPQETWRSGSIQRLSTTRDGWRVNLSTKNGIRSFAMADDTLDLAITAALQAAEGE